MADIKQFIEVFPKIDQKRSRPDKGEYMVFSPLRTEKKASVSITLKADGSIAMNDFGCPYNNNAETLAAVGKDLSWFHVGEIDNRPVQNKEKWITYAEGRISKQEGHTVQITKRYDHIDLQGNYACSKLRCHPKTFRYGIIKDGRIDLALPKAKKDMPSFYCADYTAFQKAIQDGRTVYYVEGCKDVDTLHKYGYMAISCGGSGDWSPEIAKAFDGAKKVIIFSDNDEAGRKLSGQVYRDIREYCDYVQTVLPTPDIAKGDISDFVEFYGVKGLKQLANYDKDNFHLVNVKTDKEGNVTSRKITGVYDYAVFQFLKCTRSIFVLGGLPYVYRNGVYIADVAGARLKTMIRKLIYPQFIKSTTIKRIFDLFLSDEELQVSPEDLNNYPVEWINFQNGFYDPRNKRQIPHNPKYRSMNQIPYSYDADGEIESELMEMFLKWAAADPDDREMLLQFYGLCLTLDTRQQKFLMLTGRGGSGKSIVLSLIILMVGEINVSNIPLEKLGERFAPVGLLHRLVNSCADLEISALESTALIKQAIGEDFIRGEHKGKDAISFKSYAKMIFSANELPLVKSEKTNGFYRRLLVLKLDKSPEVVDPYLLDKLSRPENIKYLLHMSVKALEKLYDNGTITESATSKEQVKQLRRDSDTVQAFLDFVTEPDPDSRIEKGTLFNAYSKYCQDEERTPLKKANFYKSVIHKGYREIRGKNDRHFLGLNWRKADGKADGTDGNEGFLTYNGEPLPWEI